MMAKQGERYEIVIVPTVGAPYRLAKQYASECGAKKKAIKLATCDINVRSAHVNKITRTIYPTMPKRERVFTWDREPLFQVVGL